MPLHDCSWQVCFHQGGHRSGHRSKTTCCRLFLASPKILQGRSFMAQRITTPKTNQGATTNKLHMLPDLLQVKCTRLGGMTFWGHRFGWGPHRFACLSHPCRVSGPFLINLIVLNSDGGSYIIIILYTSINNIKKLLLNKSKQGKTTHTHNNKQKSSLQWLSSGTDITPSVICRIKRCFCAWTVPEVMSPPLVKWRKEV